MANPKLDLNILESKVGRGQDISFYPSELTGQANKTEVVEISKKLPWKTLHGTRITIKPNDTELFPLNPRNFGQRDIADLLPLIEKAGGNSTAVDGRWVGNKVEVIAGSRRRESCIQAGLPLTVDVYKDCTDEDAEYIAYAENAGRQDISVLSFCNFLLADYQQKKEIDSSLTVELYAKKKSLSRSSMMERFAVARLPQWLQTAVKQEDKWSVRQANTLTKLWNSICERYSEEDVKNKLKVPVTTPSMLLNQLNSLIVKDNNDEPKPASVTFGDNKWQLSRDKKGKVTISSESTLSVEQYEEILNLLNNL